MKCRSRSTLGIVVGWLGIIASILGIIGAIVLLANKNKIEAGLKSSNDNYNSHDSYGWDNGVSHDSYGLSNEDEETKQIRKLIMEHGTAIGIGIIVLCVAYIGVSVLLIQGIKKKRHSLMAPWLVISAISFVINCIMALLHLIAGLFFDFIFKALFLGLEGFIIYKIYTLYRDIKAKNNERNGQILSAGGVGFTSANSAQPNAYTIVPQKA